MPPGMPGNFFYLVFVISDLVNPQDPFFRVGLEFFLVILANAFTVRTPLPPGASKKIFESRFGFSGPKNPPGHPHFIDFRCFSENASFDATFNATFACDFQTRYGSIYMEVRAQKKNLLEANNQQEL